jgi:capsular polysaccharide biosynthesis protein
MVVSCQGFPGSVGQKRMQLQDYVRVIWKRWWIVGLVAAVAAYGFSLLQQPTFTVRAEYSVGYNRLDSGTALIGGERIFNDYRNRIYNPDRLEGIAQRLEIDKTGSEMMEFVRVQVQPAESKFVIETEYYDVPTAQAIAAAVGEQLNAVVIEANRNAIGEDRVSLERVLSPQFVEYAPNKRINVLAGAILGIVLGLLLAFVLEYLDDTLKTASDVERFTSLPTVGTIPSGAAQGGRTRSRLRPATASGIVPQSSVGKTNDTER